MNDNLTEFRPKDFVLLQKLPTFYRQRGHSYLHQAWGTFAGGVKGIL